MSSNRKVSKTPPPRPVNAPYLDGFSNDKLKRTVLDQHQQILELQNRGSEGDGGTDADLPELIDCAEFIAVPLTAPVELVAGVLHKGSKLALGGSSKSFKTWTLLDLGLSVATGAGWLGLKTAKGKVLFVNFEIQPHAWQRRIMAVAHEKGIKLQPGMVQLWNLRGHASDFRTLLPKIIERIRDETFALVILDPIYKLYGKTDENKAGDVAALLNAIERLTTETGAAVAFGAHFSKGNQSSKQAIDRISGSGVFARDPDSILIFTEHNEPNAYTVESILRNFPPTKPFVVRWTFPLFELAPELEPERLKKARGGRSPSYTIEMLVESLGKLKLTTGELQKRCASEKGISKTRFYDLFAKAKKSGEIVKSGTDKWEVPKVPKVPNRSSGTSRTSKSGNSQNPLGFGSTGTDAEKEANQ